MSSYIQSMRAGRVLSCPGVYGYDAEAVMVNDGKELYAHVNQYNGMMNYTVSEKSIYDYMVNDAEDPGAEFTESYEELDEAKESEYYSAFEILDKMVRALSASL